MPDHPLERFRRERAAATEAGDNNAPLCWFATQAAQSGPAVRTLVLRDLGPDLGLAVFLNTSSPKAADLAADQRFEAACFWPSQQVQWRLAGTVVQLPAAVAAAHWPRRPEPGRRMDHLYAAGLQQSMPVAQVDLVAAHGAVTDEVLAHRPAGVLAVGLGCARMERLLLTGGVHERVAYRFASGQWLVERLVP